MDASVLEVRDLAKRFGELQAVAGVSFEVRPGEIFGLLGPNGAGKSTALACVCGLLRPDRGEIRIGGQEIGRAPVEAKRRLGLVPQDLALYEELSVLDNLVSFGEIQGLGGKALRARVDYALGFAQLGEQRRRPVAQLSGGMKRRLNLAIALLHDPALVLADEPTVGVDPQSRNHLFECLEALARAGKAVVYTSHYMEEVERLCARAAIVDHGKVVALDTLPGLLGRAQGTRRIRLGWLGGLPDEALRTRLQARFNPGAVTVEGNGWELAFDGPIPVNDLVGFLAAEGCPVAEVNMARPTLEDVFLQLTGRSLRDA
jgi:ABC-2 type transport system ATP-binding protein